MIFAIAYKNRFISLRLSKISWIIILIYYVWIFLIKLFYTLFFLVLSSSSVSGVGLARLIQEESFAKDRLFGGLEINLKLSQGVPYKMNFLEKPLKGLKMEQGNLSRILLMMMSLKVLLNQTILIQIKEINYKKL